MASRREGESAWRGVVKEGESEEGPRGAHLAWQVVCELSGEC